MSDVFDNRLRPVIEFLPAAVFIISAAHLAFQPGAFFPMWPGIALGASILFFCLGCWRLWQACSVCRYQAHLRALPRYTLDAVDVPLSFHKLFLGRGFRWDQRHTQRLVEARDPRSQRYLLPGYFYSWARKMEITLEHSPALSWLSRLTRCDCVWNPVRPLPSVGGFPPLHGVGSEDETDIWMDICERVGHKLVLGTTRVGKTRLLEILVSQDIRRGDTGAERESGFIYHRAKRGLAWSFLVLWTVYLIPPVVMNPLFIIPPFLLAAGITTRLHVAFFKKFL